MASFARWTGFQPGVGRSNTGDPTGGHGQVGGDAGDFRKTNGRTSGENEAQCAVSLALGMFRHHFGSPANDGQS
jgi:hypothetical protein